jgi:hypothetical protein
MEDINAGGYGETAGNEEPKKSVSQPLVTLVSANL